jgi:hypothetical protein
MDVGIRGDAGADVEELCDAVSFREVANGAVEELPVGAGDVADFGSDGEDRVSGFPVDSPVVFPPR